MQSNYLKVNLVYEGYVNTAMLLSESYTVDSQEVLDVVEEDQDVKVVKNTVFPRGKVFPTNFALELRNIIKEVA